MPRTAVVCGKNMNRSVGSTLQTDRLSGFARVAQVRRPAAQGRYNQGLSKKPSSYSSRHRSAGNVFGALPPYRNAYRITQRTRLEEILAAFGNLAPAARGRVVHSPVVTRPCVTTRGECEQGRTLAPRCRYFQTRPGGTEGAKSAKGANETTRTPAEAPGTKKAQHDGSPTNLVHCRAQGDGRVSQ